MHKTRFGNRLLHPLASAADLAETATGYRLNAVAHNTTNLYGVPLNPDKSRKVVVGKKDFVIVFGWN
jgi:hypothetical protein